MQIFENNNDEVQDITEKKFLEEQLKKSYRNLSNAQRLAHIGSWEMDIAKGLNYMSEEAYRILGITSEQFDGTYEGFLKLVHPDDVEILNNILKYPPRNQSIDMEFRIIRPDGSARNVNQLMEIIFNHEGKPNIICGTIHDITEKKLLQKTIDNTQEKIILMQQQFNVLIKDSNVIFEIIASDGTIKFISQESVGLNGYNANEMLGKNLSDFFEGKDKLKLANMLKLVLNVKDKNVKDEIIVKTRFGKDVHYELTMNNQLSDRTIQGIVLNWRDITTRIDMERKIIHMATHDELTDIPNFVLLRQHMEVQCKESTLKGYKFALIILDIKGFKYINEALGYLLADQLIILITQRLKTFLGDENLLFRISGVKFAIITNLCSIIEYEKLAKGIIELFSHPIILDKYELYVTINLGISTFPDDSKNMEILFKHAHIALSRSKDQGNNRYQLHSQEMDIQGYKEFELRNDLRKTIENNQIKIYFQPIVNLYTNEIIAAEALVRWEHPTWGIVSPAEFIPIAEETGFIIDLGKWVLREVCQYHKLWQNEGLPIINISINYSGIQFYEKDFFDNIKNIIDEFSVDPSFIIIEIVESVLINNLEQVILNIKKLRALGIHIALDDFGTGFSSLEYLHKFKIDILKIDRSFVMNIPMDETSIIITNSIVNLARELRIKIIAEGIETWDQLLFLRKLNCFAGQGFLYSRPVPAYEFKKLLTKKNCKPNRVNDSNEKPFDERRKFFRIKFPMLLEASMSILEISGKKTQIGNSKVLIKNIGPGGLCFISNIRFPIKRDIILQFTSALLGKEIKTYGCLVWSEEVYGDLNEYGIEYTFDENERMSLTGILNQFQIKLKNNRGFSEGSFTSVPPMRYFNLEKTNDRT